MTNHLTEKELYDFWRNTLSPIEKIKVLEHIEKCDFCAARITEFIPEEKVVQPRPEVKTHILTEAKKYAIRKIILIKTEFLRYSLKVSLAMGFALFLLFAPNILGFSIITEVQTHKISEVSSYFWKAATEINDKVNDTLYHSVYESEDNNNEKTEK